MSNSLCRGALVFILVWPLVSIAADDDAPVKEIWIYRDRYEGQPADELTATERLFAPYGYMPAERTKQITVNPSLALDEDDPEEGTCIEYMFQFKNGMDWQGAYHLVGGDSWGKKPGIDVRKLMGLAPNDTVILKFRAWGKTGGETVTLQCGGVNTGPNKSSLAFPVTTKTDPVRLTKEPHEYSIDFKAGQLTNVVDPFCVVARAADGDNLKRQSITLFVDNIRFEVPSPAPKEKKSKPSKSKP
jgi:hypothetical protein